jgi:transcription elongation GreA/GreB family factor
MKSELIEMICNELRTRLERLAKAAIAAHEAATDPGSKAESKYDTRSLEESYLATGQARQVKELGETLRTFENLKLRDFSTNDPIDVGALVDLQKPGSLQKIHFLLAPAAGGLEIEFKNKEITLLSPESPLYAKLVGKTIGELIESPDFEIASIC